MSTTVKVLKIVSQKAKALLRTIPTLIKIWQILVPLNLILLVPEESQGKSLNENARGEGKWGTWSSAGGAVILLVLKEAQRKLLKETLEEASSQVLLYENIATVAIDASKMHIGLRASA